jgi:hypothetical protein
MLKFDYFFLKFLFSKYFTKLVNAELSTAQNGDDFYRKLIDLRNEQKKSLQFMEELYNQKQQLKEEFIKNEPVLKDTNFNPQMVADAYKYNLNSVSAYEPPSSLLAMSNSLNAAAAHETHHNFVAPQYGNSSRNAEVTINKSKPPLPTKVNSVVTFQESVTVNNITNDDSVLSNSDRMYNTIHNDMRHIEQIWNDFKFEDTKSIDFNRKFEKRVVNNSSKKSVARGLGRSGSGASSRRRPASATSLEWVPRVTIPEPFSMSIRESVKTGDRRLQKASQETREEREKRIETELRECKRQFKATPAPVHVMLPLYEKLKMEEEVRKIRLKKMSQEYMEKNSRPFKLTETKKGASVKERRHSYTEGQDLEAECAKEFYARPLPEFYYNEELNQERYEHLVCDNFTKILFF